MDTLGVNWIYARMQAFISGILKRLNNTCWRESKFYHWEILFFDLGIDIVVDIIRSHVVKDVDYLLSYVRAVYFWVYFYSSGSRILCWAGQPSSLPSGNFSLELDGITANAQHRQDSNIPGSALRNKVPPVFLQWICLEDWKLLSNST